MLGREGGYSVLREVFSRRLAEEFGNLSKSELELMLRVSSRDFLNYIKVKQGYLYEEEADDRAQAYIENLVDEAPLVFLKMIDEWFDVWAMKWRQRVKLVMGPEEEDEKRGLEVKSKTDPFFKQLPSLDEAVRFALGSLILNGETCFTDLLSESTVRNALFYMVTRASSPEDVVRVLEKNPALLLDEIVKRVKNMSRYKGPLVTLRVEVGLLQSDSGYGLGIY